MCVVGWGWFLCYQLLSVAVLYLSVFCCFIILFELGAKREPTLLFSRSCNWRVWAASRIRSSRAFLCSHTPACFLPLYFICLDLTCQMLSCLSPSLSHVPSFLSSTFHFSNTLLYYVLIAKLGLSSWSEFIIFVSFIPIRWNFLNTHGKAAEIRRGTLMSMVGLKRTGQQAKS